MYQSQKKSFSQENDVLYFSALYFSRCKSTNMEHYERYSWPVNEI